MRFKDQILGQLFRSLNINLYFGLNIFYLIDTSDTQNTYVLNIQRIRTKACIIEFFLLVILYLDMSKQIYNVMLET